MFILESGLMQILAADLVTGEPAPWAAAGREENPRDSKDGEREVGRGRRRSRDLGRVVHTIGPCDSAEVPTQPWAAAASSLKTSARVSVRTGSTRGGAVRRQGGRGAGMCCHPTNEFLLYAAIPLMSSLLRVAIPLMMAVEVQLVMAALLGQMQRRDLHKLLQTDEALRALQAVVIAPCKTLLVEFYGGKVPSH